MQTDLGLGVLLLLLVAALTRPALGTGTKVALLAQGSPSYHVCVALAPNTGSSSYVKCFGENTQGELGYGTNGSTFEIWGSIPHSMGDNLPFVNLGTNLALVTKLAVGDRHVCAVFSNGKMKCWGNNESGELGYENTIGIGGNVSTGYNPMGDAIPFVNIASDPNVAITSVTCGYEHTCVLLNDFTVKCFGNNDLPTNPPVVGALGLGDSVNRGDVPFTMGDYLPRVNLGTGVLASTVEAGYLHTCIIAKTTGLVKCWGYNNDGQLGYGDTVSRGYTTGQMGDSLPYVDLGTDSTSQAYTALSIKGGNYHTCALLNNNRLKCWGFNSAGQLGQGDTATRGNAASQMGNNLNFLSFGSPEPPVLLMSVGTSHNCAVLYDGTARCWGSNSYGQLGLGSQTSWGSSLGQMGAALPVVNMGSNLNVTFVSCGDKSTCFLLSDSTLKCVGDDTDGEDGQESTYNFGISSSSVGDSLPAINLGSIPPTPSPLGASTSAPSSASPSSASPSTLSPTSSMPSSASPSTSSSPTSAAPSTSSPISSASPISSMPTSSSPTSASPTSSSPSSVAPTSAMPSTSSPTTTASPLTSSPTSESPSSASPTSVAPTSSLPTSSAPSQRPSALPTASPTQMPTDLPSHSPTYSGQTYSPSKSPTTGSPSSRAPATASPVSSSPLSSNPTTSSPSTSSPLTASPSTTIPSSSSPSLSSASPSSSTPSTTAPTLRPVSASPTTTKSPTSSAHVGSTCSWAVLMIVACAYSSLLQ